MRRVWGPQLPIESSFFRIPRFAAHIAGCWPQSPTQPRTWLTVLRFCVNAFAVALGAFSENFYGIVHLDDLFSALEAFTPGIVKFISLVKMMTLFVRHKRWHRTISRMRMLLLQDISLEKRHIMEPLASYGSLLSFVLLASGTLTNLFFNILPLVKMAYYKWQSQELKLLLPFKVTLPEMLVNFPYYPATYLMLTLSGAMTVLSFSAADGFFLCSCMYTSALFRMLKHDIRDAFAELRELEYSSKVQNIRIRRRLEALVERHNEIVDMCSDFVSEFPVIILLDFLVTAEMLCCGIIFAMSSASIGILTYIFYCIASLLQFTLYCVGGTAVSESSLEIADVLYDIDWYKCDVRTRRMILIMLTRAQKAKTIKVPFFIPSLPALRATISTAGSYIAVMKRFI
ncbi:odorant receptor 22c [Anastrepha ludens]|uniref:odorant receptor 22c n=1 Tax=Anastrepha ludens TaxID=28586 RepID=UPI0023B01D7D|nr:odorant receptor 22c [Anastrepha ludens]